MNKKTLWITETAVLTALLVVLQSVTAPAGQLVTGSAVNAVLAIAAIFGGMACGLTVAIISPFCAFLLGIGPQIIAIVPAIALGNCVYVVLLSLLTKDSVVRYVIAWLAASAAKALTLYLVVVQLLCRVLPLKPPQIEKFTAMFSVPQLITALIGGAVAMLIAPLLKKALRK